MVRAGSSRPDVSYKVCSGGIVQKNVSYPIFRKRLPAFRDAYEQMTQYFLRKYRELILTSYCPVSQFL